MKKLVLLILTFFAFTSAGTIELQAKGGPPQDDFDWSEAVDMGEDLNVCVNGYHSFEYNILAGQDIEAGTVTVTVDENGNLTFSVDLVDGALASEIHIYVYEDLSELPSKRPAPGQAPYKWEEIYLNEFEYTIEFDELEDYEDYYFVFHLALEDEDPMYPSGVAGETAYVGGPDGPNKGAWFYALGFEVIPCENQEEDPLLYVGFHTVVGEETVWAVGEDTFVSLGLTNSRWGWQITFDEPTETFDLYAGAGQNDLSKGTFIGTLTLTWDGEEVTFTLDLEDGVVLSEIQIYVDYVPMTTIAPGQFGYIAEDGPYDETWTVSLLPESDR